MKTPTSLVRTLLLAGGIGLGLFAAGPASAQYACPYGYYYSPVGGCVVAASPYQPYGYYGGYNAFGGFSLMALAAIDSNPSITAGTVAAISATTAVGATTAVVGAVAGTVAAADAPV
jgi:hypothetical protein